MKKIVCLDAGHGYKSVNGSPDGRYKEMEFTWDMCVRLQKALEQVGFTVVSTRTEEEHPSLTERCTVSNNAGADLFLSIHSNAVGGAGWQAPKGLMVFTSPGSQTEPRKQVARELINAFEEAGVDLFSDGRIYDGKFTVLLKTLAPACLIEYGFHTNQGDVEKMLRSEYREQLVVATVRGICNYYDMPYEKRDEAPSEWAEVAWEEMKKRGILDGTRPHDLLTRQELAVVLSRLEVLWKVSTE